MNVFVLEHFLLRHEYFLFYSEQQNIFWIFELCSRSNSATRSTKRKKDNDGTLFEEIEENRGQRDLEVMERKGVFFKEVKRLSLFY